jgi:hypothetical protein
MFRPAYQASPGYVDRAPSWAVSFTNPTTHRPTGERSGGPFYTVSASSPSTEKGFRPVEKSHFPRLPPAVALPIPAARRGWQFLVTMDSAKKGELEILSPDTAVNIQILGQLLSC